MSLGLVRADVVTLLREKRYEELLTVLYQAQSEAPGSAEIRKSITQVKEFLVGSYAERLGGLDQVAVPCPSIPGRSPDVVLLSRYIDGEATYGDLARVCPLGRLRTLQVLVEMYPRAEVSGTVVAADPVPPSSGPRPYQVLSLLGKTSDEPVPETARSPSSDTGQPAGDPDALRYREAFAQGAAAFIQRRSGDAVAAFELCLAIRPDDAPAQAMLRRARREFESDQAR